MRILALDIGNKWTGTAISDPLCIIATPFKTIETKNLIIDLQKIIAEKTIIKFIIGYPKTLRDTESEQTKIILNYKNIIEKNFRAIEIILFDERFSSKMAASLKKPLNKNDKLKQHSIAAALILECYLKHLSFLKSLN